MIVAYVVDPNGMRWPCYSEDQAWCLLDAVGGVIEWVSLWSLFRG